jgi:hypothetical protein
VCPRRGVATSFHSNIQSCGCSSNWSIRRSTFHLSVRETTCLRLHQDPSLTFIAIQGPMKSSSVHWAPKDTNFTYKDTKCSLYLLIHLSQLMEVERMFLVESNVVTCTLLIKIEETKIHQKGMFCCEIGRGNISLSSSLTSYSRTNVRISTYCC